MILDHKEIEILENRIRLLKKHLIDLVKEDREFTDPMVIAVSQHLDRLLNRYHIYLQQEGE
ncbi:aspartyl-phosphate phosphatase Spo0E family protein [Brevibacillus nitrificans]|uniref:Aspartyl-phosphate phosphatase Spo0E family protein n=1 Tax=Brevibacillus nitrificans TaxID=651560 RepID=A0A3M8D5C5_9BACL|nr:aspartyl-phosphate phosphatase Spo0E family protein [Brevibacillus nitrificans]